jgi:hypothetical protein
MMMSRRSTLLFLCPLFLIAGLVLIQGCGGGGETEEAAETAKEPAGEVAETAKDAGEKSKAALEAHTEDLALMGYACSMCPTEVSLEAGKCGKCGMDLEKVKVHYTCDHCGGSMMKAGKCACGMDLVLRAAVEKAEEEGHEGHDH